MKKGSRDVSLDRKDLRTVCRKSIELGRPVCASLVFLVFLGLKTGPSL